MWPRFLTYWHSAYHPYAIMCYDYSLVHLSMRKKKSTRLYQEFSCSILNTTVCFDPCSFRFCCCNLLNPAFFCCPVLFPDHLAITECEIWVVEISAPFQAPGVKLEHHLEKTLTFLAFFDGSPKHQAFLEVPFFLLEKTEEWVKSNVMEIWELSHVIIYIYIICCQLEGI